jgi:hypothetical protein
MATLVPCGQQLRAEFNEAFPWRDKASDGWIADALHSPSSHHSPDESSKVLRDHDADSKDEVHAIDVDEDLRDAQTTMSECVAEVHRRHAVGLDNRVTEIIYEGRIATAARGWVWRTYIGPNPHDKHAHFSFSYVADRENDTRPFGVAALAHREDDTMTQADRDDIVNRVVARLKDELPPEVWDHQLRNPYSNADQAAGTILRYVPSRSPHEVTQARLAAFHAQMQAFIAAEATDDAARREAEDRLAAAVEAAGPAIAALVVAGLPAGADQISQDEVTMAVKAAFRDAFAAQV